MAVGRISGPLLKANLLRDGIDLAFETDLLYLDVINGRIGVKTATPTHELTVNGTTRTTNLEVTTQANIATFTVATNTISSTSNVINLVPAGSNAVVYNARINVGDIDIGSNNIATMTPGTNLEITPAGTGTVEINSSVNVYGDLHATGSITADGDITLGDAAGDSINFAGEITSNIVPNTTSTYTLGTATRTWANIYVDTAYITTFNTTNLNLVDFRTSQLEITGNTISTLSSNTDINFVTTGTGGVMLGNFKFLDNTITNTVTNSITNFVETGTGFVRISGTNAVVIPSGNSVTHRPGPGLAELGMIRFNTDSEIVEVYNGTLWIPAAGINTGVSFGVATDIGLTSALIFG